MMLLMALVIPISCSNYGLAQSFSPKANQHMQYIGDAVEEILINYQLHRITLFLPNRKESENSGITDNVMKYLPKDTSSVVMNLPLAEEVENKIIVYHKILQNPRRNTILISILPATNEDEILSSVNIFKSSLRLIKESSYRRRPRYLVIVATDSTDPKNFVTNILSLAWTEKFLDVTVLQWSQENSPCDTNLIVQSYNPFTNSYLHECYTSTIEIFPNKLRNMHKFPIKVAVLRRPPRLDFILNSSGQVESINGIDHNQLNLISETLNFTLTFIAPNTTNYDETFSLDDNRTILNMIAEGDIDYGMNIVYIYFLTKSIPLADIERSIAIYEEHCVALVPILPRTSSRFIYNNSILCVGILLYISTIYVLVKILRFDNRFWSLNYTFRIILGNTVPRVTTKNAERIVFLFLLMLSQKFAMDLFVDFTDNQLYGGNRGLYETLEDIKDANIPLVIDKNYVNITFNKNDSTLQMLKKNVELTKDHERCSDRIMSGENIVCLVSYTEASYGMSKNKRNDGRMMKILTHKFWSAPKGYYLSRGSPYVEEFNKIHERIQEGGLWKTKRVRYDLQPDLDKEFMRNTIDHELAKKLWLIWLSGCAVSIIVFLAEILVYRYSCHRLSQRMIETLNDFNL
ncbi:hypothetical protein QAD02_010038 [Eretmocerus hayati]|uniref:Uncharacterized protein n=1 Tax=Eretmocerus hayati TaxID=131215 RepID=A0ACC2NB43_9HYME|nr:hypothetical protein QAD02_010038 [Eretmocerus hayati]